MPSSALMSWLFLQGLLLVGVLGIASVPTYNKAVDEGVFGHYPVRSYVTDASLSSPLVNWLQWSPLCDDGRLYFLTPRGGYVDTPGPMILDSVGELVWSQSFDNGYGNQAYNVRVQRYQDEDFLTFWLGNDAVRGHGAGVYHMLNSSYHIVHTVEAAGDLSGDLHEFVITPQGTALLTVYDVVRYDLTTVRANDPFRRPSAVSPPPPEGAEAEADNDERNFIWDCLIQEVSIDTGKLLFEWRASDHLDVSDSYYAIKDWGSRDRAYDWFHMNSISKDEIGNYLISARYTHSIIYIDGKTGDILWTLGGKRNQFLDLSDGTALNFAWQHDARLRALDAFPNIYSPPPTAPHLTRKLLTLFDNAAEDQHYDYGAEAARGLLLEITYPTVLPDKSVQIKDPPPISMSIDANDLNEAKVASINGSNPHFTVRVVREYKNPRRIHSSSQGSMQVLAPDQEHGRAKVLLGYGLNAVWTEYDSNGTVLCDAHYGAETSWEHGDIQSYRTYKYPWVGLPHTNPKVKISDNGLQLFVSWNGATEVRQWLLQGSEAAVGRDNPTWFNVTRVPKVGFETVIDIQGPRAASWRFLRLLALSHAGEVLDHGTSNAVGTNFTGLKSGLDISSFVERAYDGDMMSICIFGIVAIATLSGLYNVMKRWQNWRHGRSAAGRNQWRKDSCYAMQGPPSHTIHSELLGDRYNVSRTAL